MDKSKNKIVIVIGFFISDDPRKQIEVDDIYRDKESIINIFT
tara:strand:+ start:225 stop:350 length:126 start_codon:yes stop_codon:yes gene_type:complete